MFPELFEIEKLMLPHIVNNRLRFVHDVDNFYNSHTVINCVKLDLLGNASHSSATRAYRTANLKISREFDYKFLLGILNSNIINWYFLNFLSNGISCYPNHVKELPIPNISQSKQSPIIDMVDAILKAKDDDPDSDTTDLEDQIDQLVYQLYGLTDKEIAVIESQSP